MENIKEAYKTKIYGYCNKNVGEKVMFTAFTHLWNLRNTKEDKTPKDLAILTSQICNELKKESIIKEITKHEKLETPYPRYKILKEY